MKKQIIFFIGTLQAGGAERVISELTRSLTIDFDITIILYYSRGIFYEMDRRVNIIDIEQEIKEKSLFKKALYYRKCVKELRPDIIISLLTPFNIFSFFVLLGIKIPLILCERSDPRHYSKNIFLNWLRNISYRWADGIIFQTHMGFSYFPLSVKKHSVVIPNPCFVPSKIIGEAIHTEKKKKIVAVARLTAAKNLSMLIKAFSAIYNDFPDYQLVIYGEGEERKKLKYLIDHLKLDDKVILYGKVKPIYEYISDASFFVLSSDYEGMSNALMEAIALGLPVISTKVSGASELVVNGENGFLIDVGDMDALIFSMKKLLIDSDLRERMGKKSVERSYLFDYEIILNEWKHYILKMITDK